MRFIAIALLFASHAWGAEPATAELPGLELWLDANATAAATANAKSGSPLAEWKDRSPVHRSALQPVAVRQPQLVKVGDSWVARFDGDDDHLRVLGVQKKLTAFSMFVVAAPHSNLGFFRGLVAFNQSDRRDYESGFTLDLNAPFSSQLNNLNLEGRGFGGARNLLKTSSRFGELRIIECSADPQTRKIRLVVDGKAEGEREFVPGELTMDDITIGARFYTNEPNQPHIVRGFFHGDLAEVIIYNRVLSDTETRQVRDYLSRKHADLRARLPQSLNIGGGANAEPLVTVTNPPPIQMLIPGFSVHELPVNLKNMNNVRYRGDGKLYALGYNGDVWLLSDTDGDGFEETATRFWDSKGRLRGPIGMAVIPEGHVLLNPGTTKSRGIIVPSKGKVSAILDHDGDDIADEEKVIASGWKEITQNVDAIGATIASDGSIYFGLGTAAYDNAYLIDKQGRAHYDVQGQNGTIQRILPDLSRRETYCTGVRFTIGMVTTEQDELLVTDQEGATWLPNGNPFDELLLIQKGNHYGFPPQHPKHLPHVVDQPSLYDYGPQHQSTCGMAINLPRLFSIDEVTGPEHHELFGPEEWRGNLFVTGESRGKLYRTELIPDEEGTYVPRNHLIACLSMLTVDCCISPKGDLVVACHSGGPDWGSGPNGNGKLFKIRYSDPSQAQPISVWAASPREVRVAFDRPIEPSHLKDLAAQTKITYGDYVAAGDRFETIWPGYAVVQMQKNAPRRNLPIHGISVLPDRRTLIISTSPHPYAGQYAITLPGMGRVDMGSNPVVPPAAIPQHPQVDLAYSLNGVLATWEPKDPSVPGWKGWLPHFDLNLVNELSVGDTDDDRFWEVLKLPGTLTMESQFDVRDVTRPAVQPGAKLDHTWPAEEYSISIASDAPIEATIDGQKTTDSDSVTQFVSSLRTKPLPIRIRLATGEGISTVRVFWYQERLNDARTLPLNRLILPWAELASPQSNSLVRPETPELAGGSWGRGRRVFFSEEAGCAKCHTEQKSGGRIGPDLANLIHRDYASVLRDITQPSFALNPDYLSSIVALKDGRVLTGAVRSEGNSLLIGDKDGKIHVVGKDLVEELKHSSISIMPEGLPKKLGPEKLKDLLTYLLHEPPSMPLESPLPPPKPRTRAEVAAVLANSDLNSVGGKDAAGSKSVNILLVAGAKDHGPGEHDYPAWQKSWSELLRGADGVTVDTAMEWPTEQQITAADTIVFFQKGSWNAQRAAAIDAHLAKGKGLVYIHWAVEAGAEAPAFAQRIGLASNAGKLKFRHGPLDLGFETGRDHPIGRNFDKVHFHDESYWQMQGDNSKIRVLATGMEEGAAQPLFWTMEPAQGRVFVSILGHYSWTFDDPLFRILLLRGIAWTARDSIDRFNELATIGVKLQD